MATLTCEHCGKDLHFGPKRAGNRVACPSCKTPIRRMIRTAVLFALKLLVMLVCGNGVAVAQQLIIDFRFDGQTGPGATIQVIEGLSFAQTYTIDIWATVLPSSPTPPSELGLQTVRLRGASDTSVAPGAFTTGPGIGVVASSFAPLAPFNPPGFAQPQAADIGSTSNNGASITNSTADGITDFGGTSGAVKTLTLVSNTGGLLFGGGSTGQATSNGGWEWEVGQFEFTRGPATMSRGATTLFVPLQPTASQGAANAATISVDGQTAMSLPITIGSSVTFLIPALSPVWTGGSSSSWADSGNWSGPVPGSTSGTISLDEAVFNQNAPNSPLTIDANRNVQSITFDTAAVNSMTIGAVGGNALLLTQGGTIQTTPMVVNPQTINAPLVLEGDYTFTAGASNTSATLSFGGGITPGAASGVTMLTLNGTNNGQNTISGALSDNGSGQLGITMSGTGVWVLSGNNSFSGGVTINSGVLSLGSAGALNSTNPNAVTFGSGSTGILALSGNSVTISSLATNAAAGSPIVENAGGTAATLTVNNASANIFAGVIQDGGGSPLYFNKTGSGTLTLTGLTRLRAD
jgi:autotransporter-associated beta strand protein